MRRREIFIELTSLLDVILIMLFILLTQAKTTTAQALDTAAQAENTAAEAQTELAAARAERDVLRAEADEQRARADAQAQRADAEVQRADAEADRADTLQRQLWTENVVLDNSLLMTVSVDREGKLRLETEGAAVVVIAYDWADDTYAFNRLRGRLLEELKATKREAVFLVFQYDRARIYHAEYEMVKDVIQEIKQAAREREIPLSILELDIHEG